MIKTILEEKPKQLPAQQVIERVIVKTEHVETIKVLKTVAELKKQLLLDVKAKFELISKKPRVEVKLPRTTTDANGAEIDASITVYVDGGRNSKDNFKEKWEDMAGPVFDTDGVTVITPEETTTIRDADNNFVNGITKSEMYIIYKSIVANGIALYEWKWAKEDEINACTTIAELDAVVI